MKFKNTTCCTWPNGGVFIGYHDITHETLIRSGSFYEPIFKSRIKSGELFWLCRSLYSTFEIDSIENSVIKTKNHNWHQYEDGPVIFLFAFRKGGLVFFDGKRIGLA